MLVILWYITSRTLTFHFRRFFFCLFVLIIFLSFSQAFSVSQQLWRTSSIALSAEKEYSDGLTLEGVADKIVNKYVQLELLPPGK